jgi:hypothetical protein
MDLQRIQDVIRANMRRVREEHAVVLADVARAAREVGVPWDPSSLSKIETGKRDFTFEEFAKLPLILTVACNDVVTFADLLPFDPDRDTTVINLVWLLAEPFLNAYAPEGMGVPKYNRKHLDDEKREIQKARVPTEDAKAYEESENIAAELGVPGWDVRRALVNLADLRHEGCARWRNPSLRYEREQRLLDSGEDLSDPNHVRALRGNITRQLMRELRDEIAAMKENDGQHHEGEERVAGALEDA